MELWEMRNTILTWLTPSPVRDWLCNKSKRQWPWWCQRQLDEAKERVEARAIPPPEPPPKPPQDTDPGVKWKDW